MPSLRHRLLPAILCLFLLPPLVPQIYAAEETAKDITSLVQIHGLEASGSIAGLFDKNSHRALRLPGGLCLTLSHPEGIGSAYLIFDRESPPYTLTDGDTGQTAVFGKEGFLHAFLDLEGTFGHAPKEITISFGEDDIFLNELYLFSSGEVPDFVQKWQSPKEGKTDLILFSTHGDDEQLFFAGLLPYYAGELGYEVLVAYLTDHRNCTSLRCHEMLDGLWAVGVSTYPVFGPFGDYYCKSEEAAYALHRKNGETPEALLGFVIEQLRRYRPQVAVGHDIKGEYGHGQHRMYARLLCQAVALAGDPEQYPQLAQAWGTWEVPKTYLHLWPENPITMNWDVPLASFAGKTAFQVTKQLGFPCHQSQQWSFSWFLRGYEQAAQIPRYSPCQYGLYRSTVGPDTGQGDFFENLTSYALQEQRALTELLMEGLSQVKAILADAAARPFSVQNQPLR